MRKNMGGEKLNRKCFEESFKLGNTKMVIIWFKRS